MELLAVAAFVAFFVGLVFPELVPTRLRAPLVLAGGLGGGATFAWVAWEQSWWPPLMPGAAMVVVGVLTYIKWRRPDLIREAQEAEFRTLLEADDEVVTCPARLVSGFLAWRWRRGTIGLRGPRLSFVLDDGERVFDVDVRSDLDPAFRVWRRWHLRLRVADETHRLAFGHAASIAPEDIRKWSAFWRYALEERAGGRG